MKVMKKKCKFKQVKAQDLWFKILESQVKLELQHILYKDAANAK
jgi:ribonucleoside-diphosphate reductase alpha chain